MELYEKEKVETIRDSLARFQFAFDQYVTAEGKLFDIIDENGTETAVILLKKVLNS